MRNLLLSIGLVLFIGAAQASPPANSNAGGLPACEAELDAVEDELAAARDDLAAAAAAAVVDEYLILLRLQQRPDLLSAEGAVLVDRSIEGVVNAHPLILGGGAQVFTGNGPIFARSNVEG